MLKVDRDGPFQYPSGSRSELAGLDFGFTVQGTVPGRSQNPQFLGVKSGLIHLH